MAGFASPDVPAYYAYALIIALGVYVAVQTVNARLAGHPDRWAFAGTWWLFVTHVLLPVFLFWFLDYTGVVHDTSLFAAVLVAFGYRQIFAGGIQGIQLPGQASALWKPFDAWVSKVVDRITARNKLYLDRFDDQVRSLIVTDEARRTAFHTLAMARTKDPVALQKAVDVVPRTGDAEADRRRELDVLWRDLRTAEPDLYGWLLYRRGIVQGWRYWMWLKNGRSKLITLAVGIGVLVAIAVAFWWFSSYPAGSDRRHNAAIQYHQWRFLKASATERDRWRSREFFHEMLTALAARPVTPVAAAEAQHAGAWDAMAKKREELKKVDAGAANRAALEAELAAAEKAWLAAVEEERRSLDAQAILSPLLIELRLPSIPTGQASEILALLVNAHSPNLNHMWIPDLIDSLRTQSEVTRMETRKALVAVQRADYAVRLPDELEKWEPKKDEAVGDIDQKVKRLQEWWRKANGGR